MSRWGEGPPLLLLHANPGDHRDYDAVIPALAARFRVIALDWPGYGASMPPSPRCQSGFWPKWTRFFRGECVGPTARPFPVGAPGADFSTIDEDEFLDDNSKRWW